MSSDPPLTHLDERGQARMVDVGEKAPTRRRARAEGFVALSPAALAALRAGTVAKGDALAVARVAAIQGAKRAAEWIPLCHPVRLDQVTVDLEVGAEGVHLRVEAAALDRTGVEMEALTAVAAGALALYDMVKAVDRGARIERIVLLEKSGGRRGPWSRAKE